MLEPHIVEYTHAYFPVGLFDEVVLDYMSDGYVFGRSGDAYIMLRAMSDGEGRLYFKSDITDVTSDISKIKDSVRELIEATGDLRYDLIFEGGTSHAWVTELGCVADNGSFADFVSEMLANECEYSGMTVTYKSGERAFNVKEVSEYNKRTDEMIQRKIDLAKMF